MNFIIHICMAILSLLLLTLISHLRVVIDWAATKIDIIRVLSNRINNRNTILQRDESKVKLVAQNIT